MLVTTTTKLHCRGEIIDAHYVEPPIPLYRLRQLNIYPLEEI